MSGLPPAAGSDPAAAGACSLGPLPASAGSRADVYSGTRDDSRQRDLLPLPVPLAVDPCELGASIPSRPARRRAKRGASANWLAREAVCALNMLCGATAARAEPPRKPNLAQRACLARIDDDVRALGPPPGDLRPLEALRELQAAPTYDGQAVVRSEAMDVSRVSLPPEGRQPIDLDRLLRPESFASVHRHISDKVLPKRDAEQLKREGGFRKPYMDPAMRDPRRYAAMVRRLYLCGVVDLVGDPAEVMEEVGLFCVPKKSGRQRLVVDARASNFWFGVPADVSLATGAALAALELPTGEYLYTAQGDIADAFYNMALPREWRPYFALPALPFWRLGLPPAGVPGIRAGSGVWPRLAALPMGWSHALSVCQAVAEDAAAAAGLDPALRVVDGQAAPDLKSGTHLEYVDNFAALALDRETAQGIKDRMVAQLRSSGLPVHEEEDATSCAQLLGWVLDGERGRVAPTQRRSWRLIMATRAILALPTVTVDQLRRLVGHYTFLFMVRRPLLSVFAAVYRFTSKHGPGRHPW